MTTSAQPCFDAPMALDLETHLIQPGLLAPPLVCGSLAQPGDRDGAIYSRDEVRRLFGEVVRRAPTLIGANLAYDLLVLVVEGVITIEDAFDAYASDRVYDILIAQALDAIARGSLGRDPRTGDPLKSSTGRRARYSLAICTDQTLAIPDAKRNDFWRLRYAILGALPITEWPEDARQYPRDDARNTLAVALAQAGHLTRPAGSIEPGTEPFQNLTNLSDQCRAAWALHLASAWGIRTDPERVALLRAKLDRDFAAIVTRYQAVGFLRPGDGSEDQAAVKRAVARAYGATGACPACAGTGKVPSATTGNPVNCKGCDGSGLNLESAPVPRSATGKISTSRDVLEESGDDTLEAYGQITEVEKRRSTYLPFLESGTRYPINPPANVVVDTGRTSYDGPIQQMPRSGGLRECFVPRAGWVFCSIDYAAIELCAWAQAKLWLLGQSTMADVINASKDPGMLHTALAARMVGTTPEELKARIKAGDKLAAGFRQAAKCGNFGFPGGMGAATLVLAKRKRIEGTTKSPDGQVEYAGLRFCVLMTGAERCGVEMTTNWKGRDLAPACVACIKCAEDLRAEWFQQWPEAKQYFDIVSSQADLGRIEQLKSGRVRGGISFTEAANGYFQGLAADGAKNALWQVSKECYTDTRSPMFGARPVFFAHDELFSEHLEVTAHLSAPRMAEVMVAAMREYLPDVYVEAQPALMRRWYKAAGTVYDKNGKLIPDPKAADAGLEELS